jgi:ribosomal protein L21E
MNYLNDVWRSPNYLFIKGSIVEIVNPKSSFHGWTGTIVKFDCDSAMIDLDDYNRNLRFIWRELELLQLSTNP